LKRAALRSAWVRRASAEATSAEARSTAAWYGAGSIANSDRPAATGPAFAVFAFQEDAGDTRAHLDFVARRSGRCTRR
jgi:hypothetical protein